MHLKTRRSGIFNSRFIYYFIKGFYYKDVHARLKRKRIVKYELHAAAYGAIFARRRYNWGVHNPSNFSAAYTYKIRYDQPPLKRETQFGTDARARRQLIAERNCSLLREKSRIKPFCAAATFKARHELRWDRYVRLLWAFS